MEILCGGCGRQIELAEALAGTDLQCPHCGRVIHVPPLEEDEAAGDQRATLSRLRAEDDLADDFLTKARLALKKKLLVICGSCNERLTVEQRLSGTVARCPSCGEQISIPAGIDQEPIEPVALMTDVKGSGRSLDAGEPLPTRVEQTETEPLKEVAAAAPHRPRARPLHIRPGKAARKSRTLLVIALLLISVLTGLGGVFLGYRLAGAGGTAGRTPPQNATTGPPPQHKLEPGTARRVEPPAPPLPDTRPSPEPAGSGAGQPDVVAPKALAGLKPLQARLGALAGGGYVPAPLNRQFLEVKVQMSAGREPVTFDPAGGAVLETDKGNFPAVGMPPGDALLPVAAWGKKIAIPPAATRVETFLFQVPPEVSGGKLRIAGLGEAELPPVETVSAPPASALAGAYVEAGRHLKLSFDDPVMEQVRASGRHQLVITADRQRFKIAVPPTGLSGTCIFQQQGLYAAVFTHGGKALPCHLRLLPGGKQLVLYLADRPYHQVIYEKR